MLTFRTSAFLAIINRLRPKTHVDDLARLQLPIAALQDPNVVAAKEGAPRLGGIVEGVLHPMRVGDAENQPRVSQRSRKARM